MPTLSARLSQLRRGTPSALWAALEAALPLASPAERGEIVADMIWLSERVGPERSFDAALRLLRTWRHLDEAARFAVVDSLRARLPEFIRALIESDDCADECVGLEVASACARWLTGATAPIGRLLRDRRLIDVLDLALAQAVARYPEHRLAGVLVAVLAWSPAAPRRLRALLSDSSQAANLVLRSAARARPDDATSEKSLVAWLGVPALSAVARERIERRASRGEVVGLWECGHLLEVRTRTAGLSRIARPERLLAPIAHSDRSGAGERLSTASGWSRWVERLPLAESVRIEAMRRAARSPGRAMRLASARSLGGLKASPASDAVLAELARDADGVVAWIGAGMLARASGTKRRMAHARLWADLCSSPHRRIRLLARREYDRAAPVGAIEAHGRASPAAVRPALAADPRPVLAALRSAIEGSDADRAIRALDLTWRVGALDRLRASVIRAAGSWRWGDARRASKAVRLLGWVRGVRARAAAEEAVSCEDARVRASAVEALSRLRCGSDLIKRMADDPGARVRSNALVALFRGGGADEEWLLDRLAAMLADHRPGHRLSGLWAAGRLSRSAVADLCRTLSLDDRDERVRREAAWCVRRLGARRGGAIGAAWPAKERAACMV